LTALVLEGVTKTYGSRPALDNVSLTIEAGKLTSVLGPSGSGKSTLLKLVAGVEEPTSGIITLHDRPIQRADDRKPVLVWQSLALFPHMSVAENVNFGLMVRGILKNEARRRVDEILSHVGLGGFHKRRIHELSGGEQQRVALARALVLEPQVLLLDEPFGSLDVTLRTNLLSLVKRIQHSRNMTVVMITHDHDEALISSHRVILLNSGKIEQYSSPTDLAVKPNTPFVASFIGRNNVVSGTLNCLDRNVARVQFANAELSARVPEWLQTDWQVGSTTNYVLPAYRVRLGSGHQNMLIGELRGIAPCNGRLRAEFDTGSLGMLRADFGSDVGRHEITPTVSLSWSTDDAFILPG
jgi:ABC-type Fe3+/spermidine/putrescine transport system ATPase subunit